MFVQSDALKRAIADGQGALVYVHTKPDESVLPTAAECLNDATSGIYVLLRDSSLRVQMMCCLAAYLNGDPHRSDQLWYVDDDGRLDYHSTAPVAARDTTHEQE